MGNYSRPLEFAPHDLTQPILPGWQFNLFRIDLGVSRDPDTEDAILEAVGSYGRQIGHIADALEALVIGLGLHESRRLAEDSRLTGEQKQAITTFLQDLTAIRVVKEAHGQAAPATAGSSPAG
ncbi:hypothetical protein [Methylovirgula sp. 4M-Z18]|uniref:hypothetical protein n=1 Tax=Methylovirgula sp. 4M-Z18 TaxID=2293567 RepID=UPI000E2F5593|nr:hypothetical protein [Methylovirgula sp. 4M-Z18]RFB80160.1 hypothetical protein DYH55_01030 [Methylovirgula sp. 4M-Z18]